MTLSVLIITKNRAQLLSGALLSLVGQLEERDEIVIIDNASTDATPSIIKSFTRKLYIKYYLSHAHGYPRLYNQAIKKSSRDILVFFDDDCIATPGFISAIKLAHHKHPRTLIQGLTHSLPLNNIYAEIMGEHYQNWLKSNLLPDGVGLLTFDNKITSVPRALLIQHGLFDETLSTGSEDIELGHRLRALGVPIRLEPSIMVYHHERDNLKDFLLQHYRIARSEAILDRKSDSTHRVGLVPRRAWLHITSGLKKEIALIKSGRYNDAALLPVLLLLLLFVRLYGYTQTTTFPANKVH